jgi:hypothetical protein
MYAQFTHSICFECWDKNHPNDKYKRDSIPPGEKSYCCWCGNQHTSGVHVRANPETVPCKGDHRHPKEEVKKDGSTVPVS